MPLRSDDTTKKAGVERQREPETVEPLDIGIALAMTRNGFSEKQVISVLGYMPNVSMSSDELEATVPPGPGSL